MTTPGALIDHQLVIKSREPLSRHTTQETLFLKTYQGRFKKVGMRGAKEGGEGKGTFVILSTTKIKNKTGPGTSRQRKVFWK